MSEASHQDDFFHNPYVLNSTSILKLNDDCFLKLLNYLPLLDICSIRHTCKRLKILTDYYINMAYKALNFNNYSLKSGTEAFDRDETQKILSSFGHQIEALTVDLNSFSINSAEVLQIINDNCGHQELYDLRLIDFVIDEKIIDDCQRLFSGLQKISINNCFGNDEIFAKLFQICTSLTHLELFRQMDVCGECLLNTYPQLESISLLFNDNFDAKLLPTFLMKNPQLKVLKLISCNFVEDEIFEVISENLFNLETLCVRIVHITPQFEENLLKLLKLPNLRRIEFNCSLRPIAEFISGLAMRNKVECLGISSAELNIDLCNALGSLKNLRTLKLISIYEDFERNTNVRSIAEKLSDLRELHLVECEKITFEDLMEFIQRAQRLEKIVIVQCGQLSSFNVQQFIQMTEGCQRRDEKRPLTIILGNIAMSSVRSEIPQSTLHEYANIVRFVPLDSDEYYPPEPDADPRYFAEEGGAYDMDPYEDIADDDDDASHNDPYNVWNDDFDDEDLYPF